MFAPRLRSLLAVACWLLAVPASAAITVIGSCGNGGNDATCTFGAGWTSGSTVFVVSTVQSQAADQLDITGIAATETAFGQFNVGASNRYYGFCFIVSGADIGDTTLVATTVGGTNAWTAAIEIAGADGCTEDGTETGNADATTSPYNLSPTYTTTADGSIILGVIKSTGASNYSAGTGMTDEVPANGADFPGGDGVGTALGGYRITTTAGAYDLEWAADASESSVLGAYAVKASGGGGGGSTPRCMLLRVCP